MPAQRNTVISICKAIAIILMVAGHADAPWGIPGFVYPFHMPLFFITAGYFFSYKYLADPWPFIGKRIRGLYFPFLKWSVFFLIVHNLAFSVGLLNEQYGNWTGGVTHPYTLEMAVRRLILMVTSMSGYDEFLAGAFWFFRGLLVASIVFLLLYKLLDSRLKLAPQWSLLAICGLMVAFTAVHIGIGMRITTIPNGAWRETWGVFFFSAGVLYRRYEERIPQHWALTLFYFLFMCMAAYFGFSGMNNKGLWRDLWTLPLTGCFGFLMTKHVASLIDRREGRLRNLMVFIGDNTLYIFIFHIISFKVVSALKIMWYDMDWGQIGCHMVIHEHNDDLFFFLYCIVGVGLPLLWLWGYRTLKSRLRAQLEAAAVPD